MKRQAPPEIVRELRLIDPSFFLIWCECRSPDGVDHRPCRRDFDQRPICDRWVLYRRIDPSTDGRFIRQYFGPNWSGPIPDRIRIVEIPPRISLHLLVHVVRRGAWKAQSERTILEEIEKAALERERKIQESRDQFWVEQTDGLARCLRNSGFRDPKWFVPSCAPFDRPQHRG